MEADGVQRQSSAGQFRILDARLAPGISERLRTRKIGRSPRHGRRTGSNRTGGKSTPLGELHWMRFSVTLWLPAGMEGAPGASCHAGGMLGVRTRVREPVRDQKIVN